MEFILDLPGNLPRKIVTFLIADLFWVHDDSEFPTGLNRIAFFDAVERSPDPFQIFEPLKIGCHRLRTRARPGGADGVGSADEDAPDEFVRHLAVMRCDTVNNVLRLLVSLEKLCANDSVRPFGFLGHRLANVVEQPNALGLADVQPHLCG